MRVIDLINMISKGEEVPKKIKIKHWAYIFEWNENTEQYWDYNCDSSLEDVLTFNKEELNYDVQIIEEQKEKINEENLLKCGYEKIDISKENKKVYRYADKFYQKNFIDRELTSFICVYYYDKFKDNETLDYDYEFELVEEHKNYWTKKLMYGIDKNMTLDEIESKLLLNC